MNPDYDLYPLSENELIWRYVNGAMGDYEDEGWSKEDLDKASTSELTRVVRFIDSAREEAAAVAREEAIKDLHDSSVENELKKVREESKKVNRRVSSDILKEMDELQELLTVLLEDAQGIAYEDPEDIARAEGEGEAYAYALAQLKNARGKIDRALSELNDEDKK